MYHKKVNRILKKFVNMVIVSIFGFSIWFYYTSSFEFNLYNDLTVKTILNTKRNYSSANITLNDELGRLFMYVYRKKGVLVDKDLLGNITHKNGAYKIEEIIATQQQPHYTFGIYENDFVFNSTEHIRDELSANCKLNCTVSSATDNSSTNKITNLYIKCYYTRIQIAVLYKRGNFYWIGEDASKDINKPKWFGDTPRSLNYFNQTIWHDLESLSLLKIPISISHFLYEYQYSMFIECDREASKTISKHYQNITLHMNSTRIERAISGMNYITSIAGRLQKKYMLYGGSLLGWYRNCGIIPTTTDIDLGMWADEYDETFVKSFINNPLVHLELTFGKPDFGYEMRLMKADMQFDVFFIYNSLNDSRVWTPYFIGSHLYKQWIEKFELCTGELYGFRFLIVCDIVSYLEKEFGPNWRLPPSKDFVWLNVDFNNSTAFEGNPLKYYGV